MLTDREVLITRIGAWATWAECAKPEDVTPEMLARMARDLNSVCREMRRDLTTTPPAKLLRMLRNRD